MALDPNVLKAAAERSGLSEEQVCEAIQAYRYVDSKINDEPVWNPISHMTMRDCAISSYCADDTNICKQVETFRQDGGWGKGKIYFVFGGVAYETFGEAKTAELRDTSKPGQIEALEKHRLR